MKGRLARTLLPHGSTRRILRGPARGMRFTVAPGMGLSYALATESACPRQFLKWVRPGMTVYDVGANRGQMAILFAALVKREGKVVAFEPAPAEFSSLRGNIALNQFTQVVPLQVAAADTAGVLEFSYSPEQPTQGKLRGIEESYAVRNTQSFPVTAIRLDDIAEQEGPPQVIKIDVEGAAASVLRGARGILENASPTIYLELHGPEEQAGVRDELLSRGYIAHTAAGQIVDDPVRGWFSPLWCHRPGPGLS